jgi:hypothetical protein
LDIYQRNISTQAVSREDIIEEVEDWLGSQGDALAAALFASTITGD